MARARPPPPPPYEDYRRQPETLEWEACLYHCGRPPMKCQFSDQGRIRVEQMWHGRWEETPWHGSFRRYRNDANEGCLDMQFRYVYPSQNLVACTLKWYNPPGAGEEDAYWKDDERVLTGMPNGLQLMLDEAKERFLREQVEEAREFADQYGEANI